jgi:hypothetical protein
MLLLKLVIVVEGNLTRKGFGEFTLVKEWISLLLEPFFGQFLTSHGILFG